MEIMKYDPKNNENALMEMLRDQGEEWECYSADEIAEKYCKALGSSITFVAYEGEELCGYIRSLNDGDLYVYVCDLLVTPRFRGQNIGRQLLDHTAEEYPGQTVYVMSDADGYYEKHGCKREGSVFVVKAP